MVGIASAMKRKYFWRKPFAFTNYNCSEYTSFWHSSLRWAEKFLWPGLMQKKTTTPRWALWRVALSGIVRGLPGQWQPHTCPPQAHGEIIPLSQPLGWMAGHGCTTAAELQIRPVQKAIDARAGSARSPSRCMVGIHGEIASGVSGEERAGGSDERRGGRRWRPRRAARARRAAGWSGAAATIPASQRPRAGAVPTRRLQDRQQERRRTTASRTALLRPKCFHKNTPK